MRSAHRSTDAQCWTVRTGTADPCSFDNSDATRVAFRPHV